MIKIPVNHIVDISIEMLINNADETQLNELVLLANKKLDEINQTPSAEEIEKISVAGKISSNDEHLQYLQNKVLDFSFEVQRTIFHLTDLIKGKKPHFTNEQILDKLKKL